MTTSSLFFLLASPAIFISGAGAGVLMLAWQRTSQSNYFALIALVTLIQIAAFVGVSS